MSQYRDFDDLLGELEIKEHPRVGKMKPIKEDLIPAKPKGKKNRFKDLRFEKKSKGV